MSPDPMAPACDKQISFSEPVTLVGGGGAELADFLAARAFAPNLVAADSGADVLRSWGERPAAVIGDMDSIGDLDAHRRSGAEILRVTEQETTDFEKCLYSTRAPFYLGVGFMGRRFDHSLAALHVLLRQRESRVALIGEEDVVFLAPRRWRASLARGARVSIAPLRPVTAIRSIGLDYPLEGLALSMGEAIGASNRVSQADIEVEFDRVGAVIMVEKRFLSAVVASALE